MERGVRVWNLVEKKGPQPGQDTGLRTPILVSMLRWNTRSRRSSTESECLGPKHPLEVGWDGVFHLDMGFWAHGFIQALWDSDPTTEVSTKFVDLDLGSW